MVRQGDYRSSLQEIESLLSESSWHPWRWSNVVPHSATLASPPPYEMQLCERLAKLLTMSHLTKRFALLLPLTD